MDLNTLSFVGFFTARAVVPTFCAVVSTAPPSSVGTSRCTLNPVALLLSEREKRWG